MAISLSSLQKHTPKPPRIIVYGDAGLGKTTFAVSAPNPVVIQTEDGLGNLPATAFPLARSFEDVMDALGSLYMEEHDFQTLVVDSLDWLEPLIWQRVCMDNKLESIEKMNFGKGYVEAVYHWRSFFDGITALRDAKGMNVIMTAHNEIKRVEDPTLPAYDRHDLKLHKRASAIAEEFADVILFAAMQTNIVTEDAGFNQKRTRTTTTGQRVMHTVGQPAFLAKSRFPLPPMLPLTWEALADALNPQPNQSAA
ncbi:MAG: ATP-binding protein [Saprospiraceae bacterium]